jgi:hypothetical protein
VGDAMIVGWADDTEVVLSYTTNLITSTAMPNPALTDSAMSSPTGIGVQSPVGGAVSSGCRRLAPRSILGAVVLVSWLLLG